MKKNCGCQMVAHPSITQANSSLTSLIWPLTLTALSVHSCLYCASLRHLTGGSYYPSVEKVKVHCSPIHEMANICTIPA